MKRFPTPGLEEKSFASAGDRTPVIQSVVRRLTHWAAPAPMYEVYITYLTHTTFEVVALLLCIGSSYVDQVPLL
jgi:hypothetical protein